VGPSAIINFNPQYHRPDLLSTNLPSKLTWCIDQTVSLVVVGTTQRIPKVPGVENMPKTEKNLEQDNEQSANSTLVGFVRKSNAGRAVKLSINTSSFQDCATYVTSDGQTYVQLVVSLNALTGIMDGSRAVTSINHLND
jgi:hypothetical protein